jgi:hypothetical protein
MPTNDLANHTISKRSEQSGKENHPAPGMAPQVSAFIPSAIKATTRVGRGETGLQDLQDGVVLWLRPFLILSILCILSASHAPLPSGANRPCLGNKQSRTFVGSERSRRRLRLGLRQRVGRGETGLQDLQDGVVLWLRPFLILPILCILSASPARIPSGVTRSCFGDRPSQA